MGGSPVQPSVSTHTLTYTRRTALPPVVVWAGIGILILGVEFWVLARWAVGGGLHLLPAHGKISRSYGAFLVAWQIVVVLLVCVTAWCAIRSSRREGRISVFTALFVGYLTCFWLDPFVNYFDRVVVLNFHTLSVRTWGPYIPGWRGPNPGGQIETIFASTGFAFGLTVWWSFLALAILQYIARHRPHWGMGRLAVAMLITSTIVELALEIPWALSGTYAWGTGASFAIFAGHSYQIPWYAVTSASLFLAMPGAVMIYWARRNNTEVYILKGSNRTSLRLLAGVAFTQVTVFSYLAFAAVAVVLSPHSSPVGARDYMQLRGYRPVAEAVVLTPQLPRESRFISKAEWSTHARG